RRRHTRSTRDWSSDVCSSDLKEVHLGIAGELARFETDTDVLVVMRAAGSALVTPDSYAENVAVPWRRGLDRTSASRAIERNGTRSEERRVGKQWRAGGLPEGE